MTQTSTALECLARGTDQTMQLENLSPHSAARGSDLETSGCRFLEKPLIRVEPHVLGHLESVWDRHESRNVRLIALIGVRENLFPPPLEDWWYERDDDHGLQTYCTYPRREAAKKPEWRTLKPRPLEDFLLPVQ